MGTQWDSVRHKRYARTIRHDAQTNPGLRNPFKEETEIQRAPFFFFLYAEMEVAEVLHFQVPTVLEKVGLFSGSYQSRVSMRSSVT